MVVKSLDPPPSMTLFKFKNMGTLGTNFQPHNNGFIFNFGC